MCAFPSILQGSALPASLPPVPSQFTLYTPMGHLVTYLTVFLKYLFIYLFIGCVGSLLLCAGFLSSCGEQGLLFIVVHGLLIAVASLVAEHGL